MDKGLGVWSGEGCWGGEKGLQGYGWESVYGREFVGVHACVCVCEHIHLHISLRVSKNTHVPIG